MSRLFIVTITTLVLSIGGGLQVSAQQIATDPLSPTRNPQTTSKNLLEQQNDVQSSTDQETLTRPGVINIPEGEPADALESDQTESKNGSLWVLIALGLGSILLFTVYFVTKQYRVHSYLTSVQSEEVNQAAATESAPAQAPPKQTAKKKKRRAQSKKKKR